MNCFIILSSSMMILCTILLLLASNIFALDPAAKRVQELAGKLKKNDLIYINDAEFNKYVTERPRSYHVMLMLTAEGPSYGCSVCATAGISVGAVATLASEQLNFLNSETSDRIIFLVADFDKCPILFKNLKVNTVPRSFILPPVSESDPKLKLSDFALNDGEVMSPNVLISAIERSTKIKIVPSYNPLPFLAIMIVFVIILAFLVSKASENLDEALLWYRSRTLWCLVSLACFSVGVSGSISCIIRSAPLFGIDRVAPHIFATRGREQYLFEGIIVALWTIGCGIAFILCHYATKIPIPPVRHVIVILSIAMFIVFAMQIWVAYGEKTPWYKLQETLPSEVWVWFSSGVKKSSGIFKRLFRVSEIYLTEFKDWKGYYKKVKYILLDHLQKIVQTYIKTGAKSSRDL